MAAPARSGEPVETNRVWTIPNALSFLRLCGIPVFLWLVLVEQADGWAIALLAAAGFTDWLDGQIARRSGQVTKLGKLLDPFADRLYILAVLVGLALREIIPVALAIALPLRDVLLLLLLPTLRRHGLWAVPVHFIGKLATFSLLYAFPLLFLADGTGSIAMLAGVFGWAFAVWGTGLYWWAGVLYVVQVRRMVKSARAAKG